VVFGSTVLLRRSLAGFSAGGGDTITLAANRFASVAFDRLKKLRKGMVMVRLVVF
jgi:hypothetical protein